MKSRKETSQPLMRVKNLAVLRGSSPIVERLNLDIYPGQIIGLVGASGTGKSLLCKAITGCLPPGLRITADRIELKGRDIRLSLQFARGWNPLTDIAMVIQESQEGMNPRRRIGSLLAERLEESARSAFEERVGTLLSLVGLPTNKRFLKRFPRELSGGQRQRLCIVFALIGEPELLIVDEPTSALDSVSKLQVIELLESLQKRLNITILMVSHDVDIIFRRGYSVVEVEHRRHDGDYPAPLHNSVLNNSPSADRAHPLQQKGEQGISPALFELEDITIVRRSGLWHWNSSSWELHIKRLQISRGEVVAVAGRSGAGKTTLLKLLLGLSSFSAGEYRLDGRPFRDWTREERAGVIQPVFQSSYGALNPALTIEQSLTNAWDSRVADPAESLRNTVEVLARVGLPPSVLSRYPDQLSGGQQQRVCVARALLNSPDALLMDEPFSSLDPALRDQVLELIMQLWRQHQMTLIISTHDLNLARRFAQRLVILHDGQVVEEGDVETIFDSPQHPATIELLDAAERLRRHR